MGARAPGGGRRPRRTPTGPRGPPGPVAVGGRRTRRERGAHTGDRNPATWDPGASPASGRCRGCPCAMDARRMSTEQSLQRAVREVEGHVDAYGWDSPVRLFALVRTAEALAARARPGRQLPPEDAEAAAEDPDHLLLVEQDEVDDLGRPGGSRGRRARRPHRRAGADARPARVAPGGRGRRPHRRAAGRPAGGGGAGPVRPGRGAALAGRAPAPPRGADRGRRAARRVEGLRAAHPRHREDPEEAVVSAGPTWCRG